MISISIIKDKNGKEVFTVDKLGRVADRKEDELRVFDILMKSKSEIDISKCRGRE